MSIIFELLQAFKNNTYKTEILLPDLDFTNLKENLYKMLLAEFSKKREDKKLNIIILRNCTLTSCQALELILTAQVNVFSLSNCKIIQSKSVNDITITTQLNTLRFINNSGITVEFLEFVLTHLAKFFLKQIFLINTKPATQEKVKELCQHYTISCHLTETEEEIENKFAPPKGFKALGISTGTFPNDQQSQKLNSTNYSNHLTTNLTLIDRCFSSPLIPLRSKITGINNNSLSLSQSGEDNSAEEDQLLAFTKK